MYKNILLPVDLNELSSSGKILSNAVQYCRSFDAQLHIMSVVPDFGMAVVGSFFPDDYGKQAVEQAKEALEEFASKAKEQGVDVETHAGYGNIYEEILTMSKAINADLIIIAASRPDLKDFLLGPNAARVVRHAKCSVLVVRQ